MIVKRTVGQVTVRAGEDGVVDVQTDQVDSVVAEPEEIADRLFFGNGCVIDAAESKRIESPVAEFAIDDLSRCEKTHGDNSLDSDYK